MIPHRSAPRRPATKIPPLACLIFCFPTAILEQAWILNARLHFPIVAIASTPKTKQESSMPTPREHVAAHNLFLTLCNLQRHPLLLARAVLMHKFCAYCLAASKVLLQVLLVLRLLEWCCSTVQGATLYRTECMRLTVGNRIFVAVKFFKITTAAWNQHMTEQACKWLQ